jgi:recombination protein RecA
LLDVGVDEDIVEKSGAWYSFEGTRIGQGRENVKEFLKENPDILAIIERKLREKFGLVASEPVKDENPANETASTEPKSKKKQ